MLRSLTFSATVVGIVTLTVGCGISGSPMPATPDVKVAGLDFGSYQPGKRVIPESEGTPELRRLREAQRMAGYVPDPVEVDPEIVHKENESVGVLRDGKSLVYSESGGIGAEELTGLAAVAEKTHFVTGFESTRRSGTGDSQRSLSNALLRFPDAAAASQAAAEMEKQVLDWNNNPKYTSVTGGRAIEFPIAEYPGAHAFLFEGGEGKSHYEMLSSWYAVDSMVIHNVTVVPGDDPGVASTLIAKAIAAQVELLKEFTPTPVEKFSELPVDKDGMLARSLSFVSGQEVSTSQQAYYSPRGILHLAGDGRSYQRMIRDAGVDLAAVNNSILFRTRDREAAWRMQADWVRNHRAGYTNFNADYSEPDIQCVEKKSDDSGFGAKKEDRFSCAVAYGRYMAEVSSDQQIDINQKANAQLALLVENQ